MVKKIIIVIVIIGLIGGGYAAWEWFKPSKDASGKSDVTLAATNLVKEYGTDEKVADKKYLDKNIEVSGTVGECTKNQDGGMVVTLDCGDPMSGVQCTMHDKDVAVTKGQNVTIKGLCSGSNLGLVSLRECYIKK